MSERFKQFLDNITLTTSQIDDGKTKRGSVCKVLNTKYSSSGTDNSFYVGSWGKYTRIRPPRDVDVLFKLPKSVSSATEFLTSPRLAETACLIADIHMPVMTGLELHRRLIDTGHAIPTILVPACPNDVDQARALNDGVVCYLRKQVDEEHLTHSFRAALRSGNPPEADS